MRSPATLLTAGLTATAALVLLTACGSDDGTTDAAASSAPTSSSSAPSSAVASGSASASTSPSASGSSTDPSVQTFCTDAQRVLSQVSTSLDTTDPDAVAPALDKAVADLSTVQAPAEISADWEAAKQLFSGLRDAVAGQDLDTPEGQAAVQAEVTRLEAEAGDSQTRLDAWTSANCGT